MNFWDDLMGDDDHAAEYMLTYGEGPGSDTRKIISTLIPEGSSVLDVGCGPGWNLDHFKEHGPSTSAYRGLDYSGRMVRVANKRHPANQQFRVGDARGLKESDNSWDVVLLQDILEHTNGYEKPIQEALRVAKKRVIVSFWHLGMDENEHINDDGKDGWGAWYNGKKWEEYLNSLPYKWTTTHTPPEANREHWFYTIYKEEK